MEDKPHKTKGEDGQTTSKTMSSDKRRKKTNPISSDSKKSEHSKEATDSPEKAVVQDDDSKPGPSSRSSSPEPNCAICLETLQNKSFTDSCFHTFCFTCLVEWSKVKPECPLCKQQFKSIVHNVQKDLTFDEYHINSRTSSSLWAYYNDRRFRYPTTITRGYSEREISSYQESYQSQIASHRMRYAPHSVRLYSNSQITSRLPCDFRRRIYEEGLWVRRPTGGRTRLVSPEFYRSNPACTHRLLPWLNRELVTLLENNETQVTFVMELIMALIQRYEINSQEFLIHIEPYMGSRTHHFIHEFYSFAISPYDMRNYDRNADYGFLPSDSNQPIQVSSSPDSDVIPIWQSEDDPPPSVSSVLHIGNSSNRERKIQDNMRLKKLVLKKNSQNTWESIITPGPMPVPNLTGIPNFLCNPGPSTSGLTAIDFTGNEASNSPSNSNPSRSPTFSDDDECQFIGILKPRQDRTPVIVDLSSDDEKISSVIDVSSGDENQGESPLRSPPLAETPSDTNNGFEADSDVECIFQVDQSSNIQKPEENQSPKLLRDGFNQTEEVHYGEASTSDTQTNSNLQSEKKRPTLSSAIVRPWDIQYRRSVSPRSPTNRDKKRSTLSYLADSLNENYSDSGTSTERGSSSKKLKLCSVVAHFSYNHSDSRRESSHRSSHKRHKEKKKKKKKKHVHKHRRRIYSDTESN